MERQAFMFRSMRDVVPPNWEVTRQPGRWPFIRQYMVKVGLAWGLLMGNIQFLLLHHRSFDNWLFCMGVAIPIGVFAIGFAFGRVTWDRHEAAYRARLIQGAMPDEPTADAPVLESSPLAGYLTVSAQPVTVTIERVVQQYAAWVPLTVLVDGEPAGTLGSAGHPLVLTVDAGEREFSVQCGSVTGPSRTVLLAAERRTTLRVQSPITDAELSTGTANPRSSFELMKRMRRPEHGFTVEEVLSA
jgi:hypothetical protein